MLPDALWQPLVGALFGAAFGGIVPVVLEMRRDGRQGKAVRQALRSDILRWVDIFSEAVDRGSASGEPHTGLQWWDVASTLAPHYSPGMFTLMFMLYRELEVAKHAYLQGLSIGPDERSTIALKRWELKALRLVEIEKQVSDRNIVVRLWHVIRTPPFARKEIDMADVESAIIRPVVIELRELGFDVDDSGNSTADADSGHTR